MRAQAWSDNGLLLWAGAEHALYACRFMKEFKQRAPNPEADSQAVQVLHWR